MLLTALSLKRYACALCLCLCALCAAARGQQPAPNGQTDEVVRVSTTLFQTDVTVLDKQGRFVENLQREQFELRIDGKAQPITFFERVKAGAANEDAQLAAARGSARSTSNTSNTSNTTETEKVVPLDRGRVVLFYLDDLHLSNESVQRVRLLLRHFIDEELGQNDEAWIMAASGQIGFLQQLTGDKAVLRAAVERLQARPNMARDYDTPPMSEQQALGVERFNQDIIDFFVNAILADNPRLPREVATEYVHKRAQALLEQTAHITSNTLQTLNNLLITSRQIEGRKLLFFISDGFLIDDQTTSVTAGLRRITDTAARTGVVIYSIDARGLTSGAEDATTRSRIDLTNRLNREGSSEIVASQQPLRTLSSDTGGRALLNTNALSAVATTAMKETSLYYLLAWRPEDETQDNKFRRIDVSIVGRPDLVVRVRRGFMEQDEKSAPPRAEAGGARSTETKVSENKLTDEKTAAQAALLQAIQASLPLGGLPTSLFVGYADDPRMGSYVTASMELDSEALSFIPTNGKQMATIDLGGVIYNDQGKSVASFVNQLQVNPPANMEAAHRRGIFYHYQVKLKPGLYQVRVAARDSKSGRTGSAMQWIEIPDFSSRRLMLSSVLIGERTPASSVSVKLDEANKNEINKNETGADNVFFSVSRRFTRNSRLRFLTNIYNAARSADGSQTPDVALQIQILRDNQPVLTTALSKVETRGVQDLARLPYAAEIPLESMPAGRYLLQVVVIDRIAKTSATQHIAFEIA
jgi:VWFA-related protein